MLEQWYVLHLVLSELSLLMECLGITRVHAVRHAGPLHFDEMMHHWNRLCFPSGRLRWSAVAASQPKHLLADFKATPPAAEPKPKGPGSGRQRRQMRRHLQRLEANQVKDTKALILPVAILQS